MDQVKGSVMLIHGSAPFNKSGKVPDIRAGIYRDLTFFQEIKKNLENSGWSVFSYSKPGVSESEIDFNVYSSTDLKVLGDQLRSIWKTIPATGPRLVLAWSEGSLHVAEIPISEVDGVIIIGGISTNIRDVVLWQGREHKSEVENQLKEIEKLPRNEMLGLDRPVGRLIDEMRLPKNWSRFRNQSNLPILILHGSADEEVPVSEAYVWEKNLSTHHISTKIFNGKNHMLGDGRNHGATEVAISINEWWKNLEDHYIKVRK